MKTESVETHSCASLQSSLPRDWDFLKPTSLPRRGDRSFIPHVLSGAVAC
jgi:hypothetical protein